MRVPTSKCVVVGDSEVGKTCLLVSYTTGGILPDCHITVFDNYTSNLNVDGKPYAINLWDTYISNSDTNNLTRLTYFQTDIFLLCFSVISPSSFENISSKWIPELNEHLYNNETKQNVSIILVGTKVDLRDNDEVIALLKTKNMQPITYDQGLNKMKEINASLYIECSGRTHTNVKELFDEVTQINRLQFSNTIFVCNEESKHLKNLFKQ
ncbi:Rho GTPase [Heterostelium album PN500]|uniref:Rho GTPase n=1 Tax=Heterostelium pallidum (strain ATCC 26659 / Pp 5 / PN500) TaxID=670386 RepID=D3B7F7_HETP5|nr:Rho GTPase [Heterostelium album PN500]EFA82700.1 Rho GTPase [Heterostelium album PN500]|eukprot:XP_020434817.1 Rho GTPase [Heterostelium album PN500]